MIKNGKRIRRKPEAAEAEILDAAQEFLSRSDFRDLTISGVMELTGMKRATFYSYFGNRNDLVMGLLRRVEDEMMNAASVWFEDHGGGPARLREALSAAISVYAKHGDVLRAAHEASFHDESVERYYRHGLVQEMINAVATRIEADNLAGRASVPDPHATAQSLVLMNSMVMAEHLGGSTDEAAESVAVANVWIWERVIYGEGPA